MRGFPSFVLAAVTAVALSGCAASLAQRPPTSTSTETIMVSRGPCFGFCPVYTLGVTPAGLTTFDGARHTAMLGPQTRDAGRDGYARVAHALAPFRPDTGTTSDTRCETRISDQQLFTVTWTSLDGRITTLNHDRGCRSAANDALNQVLDAVPGALGVDAWAAQRTRPGASRG